MYEIYLALLVLLSSCPIDLQNKFKSVGIKLIYNIIYFYSACQIKCNQTYTFLLPYFKSETKDTNNELMIEQYEMDTNKLVETESDDIHNKLTIISKTNINTNTNTNTNIVKNKRVVYEIELALAKEVEFDVSEITFIALYLNYNDARYNINLKSDNFNYYLVGNAIDKRFVQYYINTVLNVKFSYLDSKMSTYQLELMDHDVKMVSLNADQSIIIEKNGYHILSSDVK
jgi:hypothetical protein